MADQQRGDNRGGNQGGQSNQRGHQLGPNLLYFLGVLILIVALQAWWADQQRTADVSYDQFVTWLEEGRLDSIRVGEEQIVGTLTEPTEQGRTQFRTTRVEPDFYDRLSQYDVTVDGRIESDFFAQLLLWLIPIFIFVAIWWFLFRRVINQNMGGGMFQQIGRNKAKLHREAKTGVTFDDVAGVDEAKTELREVVDFLIRPREYRRLGAHIPKGVLLVGPPGTGKTLMARAVAGEADVAFFSISGSEFVEMFVGVGAKRVRDLFEQARKEAPCIIFIDELDALGRARGEGNPMGGGGNDEKEQTLNQLLAEMDGFDPAENIVVLAATNRPEVLDPALQRAGRFDRQVMVDRPDKIGRKQILEVYLPKVRLADDVDADKLAGLTAGFTGADLANMVNEAALFATRRRGAAVTMADFENAIERIVAGQEKRTRRLNEKERTVVAYHEMGHALIGLSVSGVDPVQKVSIIPRSVGALGYTIQRPTEDRFLMTREELENRMLVLLGGRAAEYIVFGHLSTGAADDLAKVTDIARSMVVKYGMASELGHVVYERENNRVMPVPGAKQRDYGDATAEAIDAAVKALVDAAFAKTLDMLKARREALEEGAQMLLAHETLAEEALHELVHRHGFTEAEPRGESLESAAPEPGEAANNDTDTGTATAEAGSKAEATQEERDHRRRAGSVPPAGKVHEAKRATQDSDTD